MTSRTLRIGSRGSELALWQARYVENLLRARYPDVPVEIVIIHTTGDKILDTPLALLGGKGVFTKEVEDALIEECIDIAVHSLKDIPTINPAELIIGAVPERAPVEDVFLSRDSSARLMDLPDGARIATGSLRRVGQLRTKRPDFEIVDIRGNVPTRIQKLLGSNWDGMILARAGVERLGLMQYVAHTISLEWILPAVGQGALGIQCRSDDRRTRELLNPLNDRDAVNAVTAERALLSAMGGGCQVPIGAYAEVTGEMLTLTASVASLDGASLVRAVHTGEATNAEPIGKDLAATLLASGGQDILDVVFRMQADEAPVNPHPHV